MTVRWLNERVRGYADLSEAERQAIADFTLLWSLFEARILDTNATSQRIVGAAREWADSGLIDDGAFAAALTHFRGRYRQDGMFTERFGHLNLRRGDQGELVRSVLEGKGDMAEQAACVFIIILRFRNNLFHGLKWRYRLLGQLDNFTHANRALMTALERFGRLDAD